MTWSPPSGIADDIDYERVADETVSFSLDGVDYDIRLSPKSAHRLRTTLSWWSSKARRIGVADSREIASGSSREVDENSSAAIRQWARSNGYSLSSRGRISNEIIRAYIHAIEQRA
ncbi:Lsr2 family protein [Nocardia sp. NPDC056952]|uniref:histone-like nucleoid-structuring protein Lsr2 n=1 Tax=Nocardia sp. NPDC056952 TaxID=3345979 RepID=UPI00362BC260